MPKSRRMLCIASEVLVVMAIEPQYTGQAFLPNAAAPASILVAEDPFVSSFLRTVLKRHGHRVVLGQAARSSELLRRGDIAADLVITNRPEEFLDFAADIHLLYISAAPDYELASRFRTCDVLRKPFHNDELLRAVEHLIQTVVP